MTQDVPHIPGMELMTDGDSRPSVAVFYAPWYEQSTRALAALEKELATQGGKFRLVKIDVDQYRELATAFNANTIPTTLGFHGDRASCGFTGVQSAGFIRNFLAEVEKSHNAIPPEERGCRRVTVLKPLQYRRVGPA